MYLRLTKLDNREAGVRFVNHKYESTDRIGQNEVPLPLLIVTTGVAISSDVIGA